MGLLTIAFIANGYEITVKQEYREGYMAKLSKHGAKRLHERVKVKKKDVDKKAQEALISGLSHGETKGNLEKYVTKLYFENKQANNIRIFNHYVYIFNGEVLITVFALPSNLCKAADEINRKKRA